MGEYFPGEIHIGGKLPRDLLEEFVEAAQIGDAQLGFSQTFGPQTLLTQVTVGQSLKLASDQAHFGCFEDLENFCQDHDLTYRRWSAAHDEFDAEIVFWQPGMSSPSWFHSNHSHDILIDVVILKLAVNQGKTLPEVVEYLETRRGPEQLPAFEVVQMRHFIGDE